MTRQECVYLHLQKHRPSKMNRVRARALLNFLVDIETAYIKSNKSEWIRHHQMQAI